MDGELGEFQHVPPGIKILEELDNESRRRVLIHESVHAALAISGLANYHLTETVEESICTVMESAFVDIFEALSKLENKE